MNYNRHQIIPFRDFHYKYNLIHPHQVRDSYTTNDLFVVFKSYGFDGYLDLPMPPRYSERLILRLVADPPI